MEQEEFVGNYVYSVEHKGKTVYSDDLAIYQGIRLYPLRYGLYPGKVPDGENLQISGEIKSVIEGNTNYYPKMTQHGYYYHPMPLREGWLYVLSWKADGVYEYNCNNGFTLICLYSQSNDKQPSTVGKHTDFIPVCTTDTIYLFFSPVQLTEKIIFDSWFRNKRVRLKSSFKCESWCNGELPSSFDLRRLAPKDAWICYAKQVSGYDDNTIKYYDELLKKAKNDNQDKTSCYDVFFLLNDPLGICEQLMYDLHDLHLEHKALLTSVRIGLPPQKIKEFLYQCKEDEITDEYIYRMIADFEADDKQYRQTILMHTLACRIYTLACPYVDELEFKDFFWPGALPIHLINWLRSTDKPEDKALEYFRQARRSVELERLEKFLAVKERRESRKAIDKKRIILDIFLNSGVFQTFCEFFAQAEKGSSPREQKEYYRMILQIKLLVSTVYRSLSILPNSLDKYININADKDHNDKDYVDPCSDTLKRTLSFAENEEPDQATQLLYQPICVEELAEDDASTEWNLSINMLLAQTMIDTFWRTALELKKTKLILNYYKIDKVNLCFYVKEREVYDYLRNLPDPQTPAVEMTSVGGRAKVKVKNIKELKDFPEIDTFPAKPPKVTQFLQKMGQHPVFLSIMTLLYLDSADDIAKELKKSSSKVIFKSAEFLTNIIAMQRRFVEYKKVNQLCWPKGESKINAIKGIQNQLRVLGGVGLIFSTATNFIDSRAKWDTDRDAAVFYGIATISSGAGAITSLFLAKFAWAGWAGLILAVVTIAAVWLAEYYTDSSMEIFIKQTVFGDNRRYRLPSEPYKAVSELSSWKWLQKNVKQETQVNYEYLMEEFIYTQAKMPFFELGFNYKSQTGLTQSIYVRTYRELRITISCDFSLAGLQLKQISIQPYYFVDHLFASRRRKVALFDQKKYIVSNNEYQPIWINGQNMDNETFLYSRLITDTVNIEREFSEKEAYVIILIRLTHLNGTITPLRRTKGDAYLIYRYKILIPNIVGTKVLDYAKCQTILDKVFIGTEEEAFDI